MRFQRTAKVCVWSLGIVLLLALPADAQRIVSPSQFSPGAASSLDIEVVLWDLLQADVVYLGETHDRPDDHDAQLQIIQQLHQSNPQLAIAMEMFQRPFQEVLNQYLAGDISETDLRQASEYDQRWGFPWSYYAPILQYAQAHSLPVIALNTPTEITRRVARQGLEGLVEEDYQWIPPISDLQIDNPAYRERLQAIFESSHRGHGNSAGFDHFFLAQVLWDETMAEGVANFLVAHPDYQVVVLVGQGHIAHGYGIPDRVARRLNDMTGFMQRSLLLNPSSELLVDIEPGSENTSHSTPGPAIADYFWIQSD